MWHLVLWLIDLMVFGQRFLQSWWFFDSIHIITFSPLFYALPLQTSSGVYILKKCILLISRDDFIHMLGNLLNLQFRYWRSQYISAIFSFLQEVYPIAVFVFTGIFFTFLLWNVNMTSRRSKFCLYEEKILKSADKYVSSLWELGILGYIWQD